MSNLLSPHDSPTAITTALRGAGGYGKTTLAQAVCADPRIRQAFPDGVLWATLGEKPGEPIGRVMDWIEALTGERPGFSGIDAAKAALAEALGDRRCLLVIDDVWNGEHLRPFLHGGPKCARLITTRNSDTLPPGAQKINVDAMQAGEAVALLSANVVRAFSPLEGQAESLPYISLARRLGEWPILLKLANGVLRERVNEKRQSPEDALAYVAAALDEFGLTAFDADNPEARTQAAAATLGV
ncbi:MAG: hypothetical protein HY784_18565, partial [Chloroflexi bacterium]|nr:hypothetical protein [Chloroflexota bacterium]